MQHSMARGSVKPTAGIVDDIEREDDAKGYEPEDVAHTDAALWIVVNPAVLPAGWEVAA